MEAFDQGIPRQTQQAVIDITIVRNRPPQFSVDQTTVPEVDSSVPRPEVIGTFVATDPDDNVTVSLVPIFQIKKNNTPGLF